MATISVSETDFSAVACAAMEAQERGDLAEARKLDRIARKINLALTSASTGARLAKIMGAPSSAKTWRDMPSTLKPISALEEEN